MSGRYSKFNEAEDTAVTVMSHEHSSVNDILTEESRGPQDRWNLVYLIGILVGAGTLFPYNTMLASTDYMDRVFAGRQIAFIIPLVCGISSPFVQMLMLRFGHLTSPSRRIIVCNACFAVLVLLLPIVVIFVDERSSFILAVALMLALGAVTAVITGSVFGFFAMFPEKFTQAIMAGQGWSGVIASLLRCLAKGSFNDDDDGYRDGAVLFFSISAFVSVLALLGFLYMLRTDYARHYIEAKDTATKYPDALDQPVQSLLDGPVSSSRSNGSEIVNNSDASPASDAEIVIEPQVSVLDTLLSTASKLKLQIFNIIAVFVMTFLVFPGLLFSVKPSPFLNMSESWWSLILITQFNVFDLLGRSVVARFLWVKPSNTHYFVIARFLLYPLFFLCAHPAIFSHSAWVFVFNTIFSFSNGYLSSAVMMFGPMSVPDHEKGHAGAIMSLALNVGILAGSSFALIIQKSALD